MLPFPDKISYFHPPNSNFPPCFACMTTFPPLIRENFLFPPYFSKFPPRFLKIQQLFTYFTWNFFPPTLTMMHLCITQNARTGRPCPLTPKNVQNAHIFSFNRH